MPGLETFAADPAAEAETLSDIAAWCRRFTPLAAPDAPDGIVMDVSGVAHLFGGETGLMAEIETRLAAQGFRAQTALACTPEAAWALARFGTCRHVAADLPAADLARLVAPLPLEALRLDVGTVAALADAGLRRLGDIHLRPRAPIAARFGPAPHRRFDALLGLTRSAISPRFEAPAYLAERRFADALARVEDIEGTIRALAGEMATLLARHGEGARRLAVTLFRVDGVVKVLEAGTSRPVRDAGALARLFHERLEAAGEDGLDTGYGFDVIRLAVLASERLDAAQVRWDLADDGAADLSDLIDRLGARLGIRRVLRFVDVDTHVPELASARAPAVSPVVSAVARALARPAPARREAPALPARPLRLLGRPEPIETLAGLPDGPPLRFRWRRVLHDVAAVEGPERIAPEWWRDTDGATRDYFRAEDTTGLRFWLFRDGLYHPAAPLPRWYVHGLFA